VLALAKLHRRLFPRLTAIRQRGTTMVVALIALTGLGTLGTITMLSVQGGFSTATSDRSHAIALYAAESGAMIGLSFLRDRYATAPARGFSDVTGASGNWETPSSIPGNERTPGQSGNPFSVDMRAWYRVTIKNNLTDPRFDDVGDADGDKRVFIYATGYGPDRSTATVEVEIQGTGLTSATAKVAVLSWREVE
jgi:hypothetical protein